MTKRIIVIGCGEGEHFSNFSKEDQLFGIDISRSRILKVKQQYPFVNLRVMNAQYIEYPDCFFDEIYAFDVLEHVDNFNRAFSEITRILKEGGKLVIEIPYWRSELLFKRIKTTYFSEVHHKKIFYNKKLENILIKNNYTILKVKRIKFIDNLEIYLHLKRGDLIQSQLGDFNRELPAYQRAFLLLFSKKLLRAKKLRYLAPILIFTLPIHALLSIIYPKSIHIEALKQLPLRRKKTLKSIYYLIKRSIFTLKEYGLKEFLTNIYKYIFSLFFYTTWIKFIEPRLFLLKSYFSYQPTISILMPTYNSNVHYLKQAIESVKQQTYHHWQLCIVDDGSTSADHLSYLRSIKSKRINVKFLKKNLGISLATNTAFSLARGTYITFLDHDDLLSPYALQEVVRVLNERKNIDVLYSDEDRLLASGKRFRPRRKQDWNPKLLLSNMYINHLTVYRKELVSSAGFFRKDYDFAQDYDLILRVSELTNNIHHIPKILYHWRRHQDASSYRFDCNSKHTLAGKKALEDTLKRRKLRGVVSVIAPGHYKIIYK